MKKLEIGPHETRRTPDGEPAETWDTMDNTYEATHKCHWGRDVIPAPNEHYDWVHASHVLEHLPWWKTVPALEEVYRIIKPGGKVTVWVPDAMTIIKTFNEDPDRLLNLEKDWECGRGPLGTINNLNPDKDAWVYMNARVFWGARPGELGQEQHFHKTMFGYKSLCHVLNRAGFVRPVLLERDLGVDPGHGWMEVGVGAFKE